MVLSERSSGHTDPLTRAGEHLRPRQAVLLLDNCEHVVEDAARVAEALLTAAPRLRILATSRAPLGVTGEVSLSVGSLAPDRAGELFRERALAARGTAELDETTVRQVVASLDGLPLAIELAAARVRTLSLAEIASRLDLNVSTVKTRASGDSIRYQTCPGRAAASS